jgi:glutathione S-transferase
MRCPLWHSAAITQAEPIRLALVIGGVPWIDRRLSYAEVAVLRAAGNLGPNNQVPTLELGVDPNSEDGGLGGSTETFGQTAALLRWAGTVSGLDPEDAVVRLRIDGVEGILNDIKAALMPQWYKNALGRNPKTGVRIDETPPSA